jgi:two-component sensor histidine kinase
MIVHELVVNCFKHAFPGGRKGKVVVSCRREPGSLVSVAVQDDGVGMPERRADRPRAGLGWTLIEALSKQLEAKLLVACQAGTHVQLCFSDAVVPNVSRFLEAVRQEAVLHAPAVQQPVHEGATQ